MSKLRKENGKYIVDNIKLNHVDRMFIETGGELEVTLTIVDKRIITENQRHFIFALIDEVSRFTGEEKNYLRALLQQYNANLREIEVESLKGASIKYANGLIDTIIEYCIQYEIPIAESLLKDNHYSFTQKQTYMMILKRLCVVCGQRADIHHVDAIGMGNDRNKVEQKERKILPLCRTHHTEIHNSGNEKFIDKYHLEVVVVDEKLEYFIKNGKIREYK